MLDGFGRAKRIFERVVLSMKIHTVLAPEVFENLHSLSQLIHAPANSGERDAIGSEFTVLPPCPYAAIDTSLADGIKAGHDLRQHTGMAIGIAGDQRPQA